MSSRDFIDDLVDVIGTREDVIEDEAYGQLESPADAYEPEPEDFDDDSYE